MLDPFALLQRFFRPFDITSPVSNVALRSPGGSVVAPSDRPRLPPNRHQLSDVGQMYSFAERRLAAPPFANLARYHVVWHTADARTLVARNANAPVIPPRPDAIDGPVGCPCRDRDGQLRFGAAQAELSPWCPSIFKVNDSSPYRPDIFSGHGPCAARQADGSLAQWEPSYLTRRPSHGYALTPTMVAELTAHDRLDAELRDLLGIMRPPERRIPSPNDDASVIREEWGFYAAEFQIERGEIGALLIGRDLWITIQESEPDLFLRMTERGYFSRGLLGAWFDDPVRDFGHLQMFLQHGMPVFYEWTDDMDSFSGADVLRPRDRSLFVTGAGSPLGLTAPPTPRPRQGLAHTVANAVPHTAPVSQPARTGTSAAEVRSQRRLVDRISSPPTSPVPAPQRSVHASLASRIGPPTGPSTIPGPLVTPPPSGRLLDRSALTCARTPHEFSAPRTVARVARLLCEFRSDGATSSGPLRVWIHDIGSATTLARRWYRRGLLRTPADLARLAREYNMAFNTAVRVDAPDPWSPASADLHDVPRELRVGNRMLWRQAFETWSRACRELLTRTNTQRAATLRGGLLARMVKDFAATSTFAAIPTDLARLVGCPEPILVDGVSFHDDWLSEDELAALLGMDYDAAPGAPRSMWPPPAIWMEHAGGVWTAAHERWYTERRTEIATGGGGASFYTPHRWHTRLRNWSSDFNADVLALLDG